MSGCIGLTLASNAGSLSSKGAGDIGLLAPFQKALYHAGLKQTVIGVREIS